MDALVTTDAFLFEGFRLDRHGLSRCDDHGCFVPVPLGSRALEVLGVLVAHSGDLVARDEIMNVVWPGVVVEGSNLPVQIAALRRVLDEGRPNGSCIQTVPGRGYRFVGPVTWAEASPVSISRSGNGAGGSIADAPEQSGVFAFDGSARLPTPSAPHRLPRAAVLAVAGALFLAGTVLAALNWQSLSPWRNGAAPRLSIVVLPFANLNNDPDQQYFADGITEDLTTDLSRISDMLVISRDTAFTYKNKPVNAKQIGRELSVRYVLEGSIRRSGDRVRVNTQLVDAATDTHLWADRFDSDIGDLFALQNEITGRLANSLGIEMTAAEAARSTKEPDALDNILRGRAAMLKPNSPESSAEAISLFERALALDPQSVEAQSRLANALVARVGEGISDSPAADLARAEELVNRALAANPRFFFAHQTKGRVLQAHDRHDEAAPEFETTLALNHNAVWALSYLASCKLFIGPIEDAIPLLQQAIRLSPREPRIGWWYWQIGNAHLLESRTDEAIDWYERARSSIPAAPLLHGRLAAAYGLKGETERAAAELAEARRLSPVRRYASLAQVRARYWGVPKIRALYETTLFVGWRKAGMPEE